MTALEDRTTPATFAEVGTALNLNLDVFNTRLGIVSAGTSYTLTLIGDTWSGTDTANVTGNGTTTLTVTTAGLAAFNTVNVTNSDNGVRVTFNDSGANAYSDDFNITLTGIPNPVSFVGATSFGSSNLTVDTAQSINIVGVGTSLTSSTGDLTLKANAGASPTAGDFDGISVATDALVQVTGSGKLTLQGRGGTAGHGDEIGVAVFAGGRVIGGTGAVSVTGTGGTSTGNINYGVYLDSATSAISSTGGDVSVTGTGGGFGGFGSSASNSGVVVANGAELSAGGTGAVTIIGTGGASAGNQNFGVYIDGSGQVNSAGGNVTVVGAGGGSGTSSQNAGLFIGGGSQLSAGGKGTVSVTGTGGAASGASNHGVFVGTATITSSGGAVAITGTAGGTGVGIFVAGTGTITTATNGGDLTLTADSVDFLEGATVAASTADAVTLRPLTPGLGIDLGGAGGGPALALTDELLDQVAADTLRIGDAGTGAITITAPITRTASTNTIITGSSVTAAVAGTDLSLAGGTLSFGPGTTLASTVTGTTPDTGYDQLSVDGSVNLSGVGVALTGPLVPAAGNVFDLVTATGTVSGNFGPLTTALNGVTLQTGTTATTGFVTMPTPTTTGIPPQAVQVGGTPVTVDLGAFFTSLAVPLTYAVVGNTNPTAGSAAVSGSMLTLTGLAAGTTDVTVRMTDANGLFVDSTFTLTATPATTPPSPPPSPPPPPSPAPTALYAVGTGSGAGQVNVYNADGSLRFALTPYAGFAGGVAVATGDVNSDGTADVIVGTAVGSSHVKVFDGLTGAELFSFLAFDGFLGGIRVASGDVNNDGFADVIVGTATAASHVKAFDLRTGGLVQSFLAFPANLGVTVGSGDVNNDGSDDVIVGAAAGSSQVGVFDGRSGLQVLTFTAFAGYPGGVNVAGGDLDGDGFSEVLVGANANAHVKAFGADGGERLSFLAYPGFGGAVRVGSVDADGDGRAELLTGAGPGAGPHVKRFDGQTLAVLDSFYAFDPSFTGGIYVD